MSIQTFEELISQLDFEKFTQNPVAELQALGLIVDASWLPYMSQIEDLDQDRKEKIKQDWGNWLQLGKSDLDPDKRRKLYADLAQRYRLLLDWKGEPINAPDW